MRWSAHIFVVLVTAAVAPSVGASRRLLASIPSSGCSELLYTLQSGDTIAQLASSCGTEQSAITNLNPQITDPTSILAGDQICLPTVCTGKIDGLTPSQGAAATPSPSGTCDGQQYTVEPGDTIAQLATACGTDDANILADNPQVTNADSIAVGDQLCLPATCNGLSPSEGPAVASAPSPTGSSTSTSQANCSGQFSGIYRAQSGDFLQSIADSCNVTREALLDQNQQFAASPDAIQPNDQVCVPSDCRLASLAAETSNDSSGGGLSGGAIAGVVVGVLAVLALAAVLAFFLMRRSGRGRGLPILGHKGYKSDMESQTVDSRGSAEHLVFEKEALSGDQGIAAVPYSHVIRSSDVVHMEDIALPRGKGSSVSFDSLPVQWQIPLSSVKLMCQGDKPIVLGKGGYGMVYKAIVRKEDAAIKIVTGGGKDEQARLLHEITILEQCKSAHIVQFLGYSISEDGLLLCMEYLAGGTLYTSLRTSNEFQWYNRGRQAMRAIAAGLYCLHEQDIGHLDLKTPNILIGSDKKVKIADLGLGKLVTGKDTVASQLGTLGWMAPEVVLKGTCALQSDVWSFGTILWEVCTLRRPDYAIRVEDIVVPDDAPQEVLDLINKCRAEHYWDRPSMEAVCDMLDSIPHKMHQAGSGAPSDAPES